MNDIDYESWAAEYKEQEDKLKAKITELKTVVRNKRRFAPEERLSCAIRIDRLGSIYYETKAVRIQLEKRAEQWGGIENEQNTIINPSQTHSV